MDFKLFRRSLYFLYFCLFFSLTSYSQVVINEYSCANLSSFADNFGNFEDWIELYNTSASPVNLTGFSLSDKKTNPGKWKFGNVTIGANGFLRIWASGNNVITGANLHTNFKLTQCKPEAIVFSAASGTVLDSLTLNPTQLGHSRGRTIDGAPTWSVFLNPTPGASNTNPYQNYATTPVMSVAPGFYPATQNVSITSPDPNITIRYTINGSTPTATSTLYSGPVVISTTKVLRAIAISSTPTIPASFIESNTYFINITHKTEVVSIFGDQIANLMGGNSGITPPSGLEYFDNTGIFRAESYGEANKHGNDSWAYPQRGIDFVSVDEYGYDYALHHAFFNTKTRTDFQRIILKACANDNYPFEGNPNNHFAGELGGAHIRDAYVHTVSQKAHMYLDERTWAPCILYVNGNYWGVYDLREKVDDADFTDYYYNTGADSLQYLQTWGATWPAYGGAQAQTDWTALSNYIQTNSMAVPANYKYVDSLFSVKSLADYVILNSYCVTSDWLNWNTAWWRGLNVNAQKKKWRYTLWDEDATFKHYINYTGIPNQNANADPCDPQTLPNQGGQGHVPILNALLQNPGFKQYYVMRYFDLLNTGLSCNRMTTILDSMILVITPEMPGQIAKWGGNLAQWQSNVQALRNFILARCDSVMQGFSPCNGATGPYPIKLNVVPAGAGTVDVNSVNIANFIWSANYPGGTGLNINFVAHPNTNYCFDHWEFQNHTPLPGILDTAVFINLIKSDSIIAHFSLGGSASVTATQTTIFCGDSAILNVSSGTSFIWSPSAGLSNTTIANPVANPSVTTTYTVITSGQCGTDTASITINVSTVTSASVTATSSSLSCGDSTILHASGGNSFIWSPTTGLSNTTIANPVATPSVSTSYTVIVTSPCGSDTATIPITVSSGVNATAVTATPTLCIGDAATLLAGGGANYLWTPSLGLSNPSISNPVATPTATTTYSVVASNLCGSDTASITLTITQPPVPSVSGNVTICSTESAQLVASGGTNYVWSPPGGLSCTNCPDPVATPVTTTTYTFVVSNTVSCFAVDTVTVFVTGECPEIYVPTGFSPNGDNNNDMLYIFGVMKDLHFTVYNRWGEKVFETTDQLIGWDGTFHGKQVQSGVYAYKFSATDSKGNAVSKSGNITVIH
jgi:gliding motility-associated-like protein